MTTPKDRAELLDLLVKADATASVYSTHIQQEESRLATLKAAGLAVMPVEPTIDMLFDGTDTGDNARKDNANGFRDLSSEQVLEEEYRAMLAASPYREKE